MAELKPCPFCGGGAEIHKRRSAVRYYAQSKKKIPKNGTLTREITYPSGDKSYEYSKAEYGARCLDTACIGRVSKVYPSEIEAAEGWNQRAGDSDA